MRKYFTIAFSLLMALAVSAQNEVTKFLGIPVDGYKPEMIQKLEEKGFIYDELAIHKISGEYNGAYVSIYLRTNNNIVNNIVLCDQWWKDETKIVERFNLLCGQFLNNSNYEASSTNQTIPEGERVKYEMTEHGKKYQAIFYQKDKSGKVDYKRKVWFEITKSGSEYKPDECFYITMYYENLYNQPDGSTL